MTDTITIHVPVEMRHHRVEIILLPLDDETHEYHAWSKDFFERFAGCLPELQRLPEGDYENREPL